MKPMPTVRAIFENGVFRPTQKVPLPEHSEVEFEPRPVPHQPKTDLLNAVYETLNQRFRSGETDVAARHNEHQP
jgi:predicted DNA-binding antitoxin AbrB/MazE fold protein